MTMKATCKNNPNHKKFVTVAHVAQDWIVDENGEYLDQDGNDLETVAKPDPGNTWTCYECGEEAEVTE